MSPRIDLSVARVNRIVNKKKKKNFAIFQCLIIHLKFSSRPQQTRGLYASLLFFVRLPLVPLSILDFF
jgi:hypothetical protein